MNFTLSRQAARCRFWSPAIVALLLARAALHGALAWLVWRAAAPFWAPLFALCGGALPATVLALLAAGAALHTLRDLPLDAELTPAGLRFAGTPRFIASAEILGMQRATRGEIAWLLLWPATPWRFLTLPVSLDDWWRIETASGRSYLRCPPADAPSARQRGAPLAWPWPLEVALFLALLYERSLAPLLIAYAVARIVWIVRRRRRQAQWRRVRLAADPALQPIGVVADRSPAGRPASAPALAARDRAALLWRLPLLPLLPLCALARAIDRAMTATSPSASSSIVGERMFVALSWPLWRAPQLVFQPFDALLAMPRRSAGALARCAGWLSLGLPLRIGQALVAAASLAQTLLLTLVGLAAALLIAWPISLLVGDPQSPLWRESWQVRAVLWRYGADDAAQHASALLEKAQAANDSAATLAVLRGGAVDGVFRLRGWQSDRRQALRCRDAVASAPGITLRLDEAVDRAQLLREAACPGAALQSSLLAAAFVRAGGVLAIDDALASGDPALLPIAGEVAETRDWQGRTPLLQALDLAANADERRAGRLVIAAALAARGADLAAVDRGGRSAAYLAAQAGLDGDRLAPYLRAADVRARSALGATLVHGAAASGQTATLADVVRAGADLAQRTHDGRSALHFARGTAIVGALLARGFDADLRDARGRLPLHAAIIAGDGDAALALLRVTLAPQTVDVFGRAPADYLPARRAGGKSESDRSWNELAWQLAERTRK